MNSNNQIKILGCDVGKQRSAMAIVSIILMQSTNEIFVDFAKQYQRKTDYANIEDDMAKLHKVAQWDYIGVEVNGVGGAMIDNLRRRGLPVKAVTTSGKITDIKKLNDYSKLSKPNTAKFMLTMFQKHKILFPKVITNPHLKELIKQNHAFKEHVTASGASQFYAEGKSEDHLTMGLMVACRLAQRWIKLGTGGHVLGPIVSTTTVKEEDLLYV